MSYRPCDTVKFYHYGLAHIFEHSQASVYVKAGVRVKKILID